MRTAGWVATVIALLGMAATAPAGEFERRQVDFAGYTWLVKGSTGRVGPGPNYFSDSPSNVWVDDQNRLHLRITKASRGRHRWFCAEVLATVSLGYGTYRFDLETPVDGLDPRVVLGLFTWSDAPVFAHRELDIEFSRWGDPNALDAQYVVQPFRRPGQLFRFNEPPGVAQSIHQFLWRSVSAAFESFDAAGAVLATHTFTSGIPQAGGEAAPMNLWLNSARGPTDGQEAEVVIRSFTFLPAS